MNLENFKSLIEVQSLEKSIQKHEINIDNHNKRIKDISNKRDDREKLLKESKETLANKKSQLAHEERLLAECEKQISKAEDYLNTATSQQQINALDKELSVLKPKQDQLEESGLNILDCIEQLEDDIINSERFLSGSIKTLSEIQGEVDSDIKNDQKEIDQYLLRINGLKSECPKDLINVYDLINKKYKYNNPLTFVKNNSCANCRFEVNRSVQMQVAKGNVIEFCLNCERIIAPSGI